MTVVSRIARYLCGAELLVVTIYRLLLLLLLLSIRMLLVTLLQRKITTWERSRNEKICVSTGVKPAARMYGIWSPV